MKQLREGGIVAYPTETFYGLGVDAHSSAALEQLIRLKGRPEMQPFPVLLPDVQALGEYVEQISDSLQKLIAHYWPGPLTLVLKPKQLPNILKGLTGGIGFRVTAHPIGAKLAASFGRCITSTSANRSGESPARAAHEVRKQFPKEAGVILDGGQTPGGQPSTVIDATDPTHPKLVRQGAISWEEIQTVWRT